MYRLTDEKIKEIILKNECSPETRPSDIAVRKSERAIAKAAQAKLQARYRDMTPEELRKEIFMQN